MGNYVDSLEFMLYTTCLEILNCKDSDISYSKGILVGEKMGYMTALQMRLSKNEYNRTINSIISMLSDSTDLPKINIYSKLFR